MKQHALRLGLILSLSLLWFVVNTQQAFACSCAPPDSPSEELTRSAAVFSGKVIDIREYKDPNSTTISSTDPTTVVFEVDTVWKGPSNATVYFTTPRSEASCGFSFAEGEEYIVYSRNGSSVSLCSRTNTLSQAQVDLEELGEGRSPQPGSVGPTQVPHTPSSGSCAFSNDLETSDAAWLGIMAGLVWFGVRRRPRH